MDEINSSIVLWYIKHSSIETTYAACRTFGVDDWDSKTNAPASQEVLFERLKEKVRKENDPVKWMTFFSQAYNSGGRYGNRKRT